MPSSTWQLIYVADPMCSWCWGFSKELQRLRDSAIAGQMVEVDWVMGGLAPDSEAPMPEAMRAYIQEAWNQVEQTTGAEFNRDFWTRCEPRRSTYPSCRAVITAETLRPGSAHEMFEAIQRAYYLEASNPSDTDVLSQCAVQIGFDRREFEASLNSENTNRVLEEHFAKRDALQTQGFPSLYVQTSENPSAYALVMRGYATAEDVKLRIESARD